ncbi:MAG: hypothetical protein QOD42_904 [Sphingomonadales bacterium]|jgi:hypothetical protein|nr:hypothetical protein [Sphingomonadales bacterium]
MSWLQGVIGALLFAAQPPAGEPPAAQSPPAPARSVAGFAAFLQEDLPHRFNGYTAVSARAEGDLLVLTMDGRRGWRQRKSNAELTRETMSGFCGPDGNFLTTVNGGSLRIDTLEDGGNLERGTVMSECPAAGGAR